MSCHTPQFKRIDSIKKELPIHNSLEKRLKESILQLSTPEMLGLYSSSTIDFFNVIVRCRQHSASAPKFSSSEIRVDRHDCRPGGSRRRASLFFVIFFE